MNMDLTTQEGFKEFKERIETDENANRAYRDLDKVKTLLENSRQTLSSMFGRAYKYGTDDQRKLGHR